MGGSLLALPAESDAEKHPLAKQTMRPNAGLVYREAAAGLQAPPRAGVLARGPRGRRGAFRCFSRCLLLHVCTVGNAAVVA